MSLHLTLTNDRLRRRALTRTLRRMCADITDCDSIDVICPMCGGCTHRYTFVDGKFLCNDGCVFTFEDTFRGDFVGYDFDKNVEYLHDTLPVGLTCDESHALIRETIPITADVYERKWWPVIAALYA